MNEEEKETTKEQDAAQALILNTEEISESKPAENISSEKIKKAVKEEKSEDEHKVFRKYKIKDIVFLAIMAACMLVTGSIMPLIGEYSRICIDTGLSGLTVLHFPDDWNDESEKAGRAHIHVALLRCTVRVLLPADVRVHYDLRGRGGSADSYNLPRV